MTKVLKANEEFKYSKFNSFFYELMSLVPKIIKYIKKITL